MQAKNSAARSKYEKYKPAKTIGEARKLGADARTLAWDFERGFLKVPRLEKKKETPPVEDKKSEEKEPLPVEDAVPVAKRQRLSVRCQIKEDLYGILDPRTSPIIDIVVFEVPLLRTLLKALEMLVAIPDCILDKVVNAKSVVVIIIVAAAWRNLTGDASGRISDKLAEKLEPPPLTPEDREALKAMKQHVKDHGWSVADVV